MSVGKYILWLNGVAVVAAFSISMLAHGQALTNDFTVEGRLFDSSGNPISTPMDFTLQVLSEVDPSCVLYSETQSNVSLSAVTTDGQGGFSLRLGSGISNGPANTLSNLFLSGTITGDNGGVCNVTLATSQHRLVRLKVSAAGANTWETLSPDVKVTPVPFALAAQNANSLQGVAAAGFIQVNTDVSHSLSQANAENIFSNINYPKLINLLSPTSAVGLGSQRITNLSDPTAAQDAATKNYSDTNVGGKTIDLTALANGYALVWNSGLNKWVASNPISGLGAASAGQNGYLSSGDWTTFNSKLGPATSFAGDVSGVYNAMSVDKIKGYGIDFTVVPVSGTFLKYNGANWNASAVATTDVSGLAAALGNKLDVANLPASCTASQTLTFVSVSGVWSCTNITVSPANFASQGQNTVFAGPTGAAGAPTFRALAATDLPVGGYDTTYFKKGGNAFGAAASLGTTDNNQLTLMANTSPVMTIDPSGDVGIGVSSPTAPLDVTTGGNNVPVVTLRDYNGASGSGPILSFLRGRGTLAAPSAVLAGDDVMTIASFGYYPGPAVQGQPGAAISFRAAQNYTNTAQGTDMVFYTMAQNTTSATEKMRLVASGAVGIGTNNPHATLDVLGSIRAAVVTVAAGGTADMSLGNTVVFQNVGGSTLTLNNVFPGGEYTILITDTTSRQYTLNAGCSGSNFKPANAPTTTGYMSSYVLRMDSSSNCYIAWATGAGVSSTILSDNSSFTGSNSFSGNNSFSGTATFSSGTTFTGSTNSFTGNILASGGVGTTSGNLTVAAGGGSATILGSTAGVSALTINSGSGGVALVGAVNASSTISAAGVIDAVGGFNMNGANAYRADGVNENVAMGLSGYAVSTGTDNFAGGPLAMNGNTTGFSNVGVGYGALLNNTSGFANTAVGANALALAPGNGSANTGFGSGVGQSLTGSYNTLVGFDAGQNANSNNTMIGNSAGVNATGSGNTLLGYYSGSAISSGNNNICVGSSSCANVTSGGSNIVIGNVNAVSATASNQLNIGNIIYGDTGSSYLGIGNTNPANRLNVNTPTTADSLAQELVSTNAAGNKGLVIQGKAGQSGNLQEWQDSTGTILAKVDSSGGVTSSSFGSTANMVIQQSTGSTVTLGNNLGASGLMIQSGTGGISINSPRVMVSGNLNTDFASAGGANAFTATLTPTPASYVTGLRVTLKVNAFNTGAATLNVNGLGAKTIQYKGAALVGGELDGLSYQTLIYDGANFQLLGPVVLTGSTSVTFTGFAAGTAQEQPVTVNGAATSDAVTCSPPVSPGAGSAISWSAYVSAANTVKVHLVNSTLVPNAFTSANLWKCTIVR